MKRLLLVPIALLLVACGLLSPKVVVVTATPPPQVIVVTATAELQVATSVPTRNPEPQMTRTPKPSPAPTWEPIALAEFEVALREGGYRRFPFVDEDGTNGFTWVNDNSYERVQTWEGGTIKLEVLHDRSATVRSEHMEHHLEILDAVLPTGFMTELRAENDTYNRSVGPTVSGDPSEMYVYNDEWETKWGEYNPSESEFGGYQVRFALWWWQTTCPAQYEYCYFYDFPGLEFTGDSSFVFYSITIWLPSTGGETQSNA